MAATQPEMLDYTAARLLRQVFESQAFDSVDSVDIDESPVQAEP